MNDAALLELWESALPLAPQARERALAQAAGVATGATLGQQHAALLRLRKQLFGRALALRTNCPACALALDFEIDTERLPIDAPGLSQAPGMHELRVGNLRLRFRAPSADDLDALAGDPSPDANTFARHLFERCVIDAFDGDRRCEPDALGAEVQAAVAQALDSIEPCASLGFSLDCDDCGTHFEAALDSAGVLWHELRHHAEQVLADVAALAGAYGWHEREVLAMNPVRRSAYLQLAGGG